MSQPTGDRPVDSEGALTPRFSWFNSTDFADLTAELLSRGNTVRFRAGGTSMVPIIRGEEVITVEPVVPSDIRPGEIILCRLERGVTAHRVLQVNRQSVPPSNRSRGEALEFKLRGDASSSCDEPVRQQQILGRVAAVERGGRAINLTGRRAQVLQRLRVLASRSQRALRRQLSAAALLLMT